MEVGGEGVQHDARSRAPCRPKPGRFLFAQTVLQRAHADEARHHGLQTSTAQTTSTETASSAAGRATTVGGEGGVAWQTT
jgi:hypothetical protein